MALTIVLHKGKEIVMADFSNKEENELIDAMTTFNTDLVARGKKNNRILMDQTNTTISKKITKMQKTYAVEIKDYQRKLALLGVKGIQRIMAGAIMALVDSDVRIFDKKEEAMDWLAKD